MTLPLFTGATNTVQLLADRPNQTDGLTPAQLKLKFDQHAINYETYSNDVLLPAIETELATKTTKEYVDGLAYNFTLGEIPNDTLTNAKMANEMKKDIAGGIVSNDIFMTHLADSSTYSTAKSNKDTNNIFTEVDLKRRDGTLIMKSVLSGGTSPLYTTRTETYYATNGITVTKTVVYTRTYDSDENLTNEVMN